MELCVALDLPSMDENLALIEKIKSYPVWLKVGLRSYIRDGEPFIHAIKAINPNFKIFLDVSSSNSGFSNKLLYISKDSSYFLILKQLLAYISLISIESSYFFEKYFEK